MLRSKQLLPFVKGARAWIVAGSVSKPPPLDGAVSPGGNEDSKPEQGYKGTKSSHSTKSSLHIYRREVGPFRQDSKPALGTPSGSKFEKIHEISSTAFIPGQNISRRSGSGATAPIPSKQVNVVLPSPVKHDSVVDSQSADLADLAVTSVAHGQAVKTEKVLVAKCEPTGKTISFAARKSEEVGLASLSSMSDQSMPKSGRRISEVKHVNADCSSLQRSCKSEETVPLKKNIRDNRRIESKPPPKFPNNTELTVPLESTKPFRGNFEAKPPSNFAYNTEIPVPCESTKPSGGSSKRLLAPEALKSVYSPNGTLAVDTVNAPVMMAKDLCNLKTGTVVIGNSKSIKPATRSHHPTTRQVRSNTNSVRQEPNGVVQIAGQKLDMLDQKSSRLSKGKEPRTGVPSNRRRANNVTPGTRQSHWSARDSGASSDMVDQVGSILQRMGWTSQTVDVLASLNSRLSTFHVNEVLKHQREPGLAWEFFKWAKTQSGYKHDVRTYTTMIGILGRVRNFKACDMLLNDMRMEGCNPSVVTFNRLIHSYGRANNLGEALNLFHKMQEQGCQPDRVTYVTLMDLYSKAGFHDIAMDICQKMWMAGFEPDTFSYTVIINCLGKAGNLPAAFKLFLEMIERGHIPNLVTYNTMIDLHAKAGKHHMALKLYNDMQDSGFRPDNVTYSVIMEVLGHSGHLDEAEKVFFEMEQAGWSADATNFGCLVYMWGQTGNVKKATEWYKRMLHSGLSPNVPTCNSLLWAYMRVNDYVAAEEVLESMPKWGLCPTLPTYTLLLSSCTTCENQQDVDFTLQIMSRTGHLAHSFLCRLLNEIDPKEIMIQAHQFFDSLHDEEQENKRSFADALIEFLYKLDHKGRAGTVWEVAMEKNLYPSALSQRAPNYWIVDLHVMSMGTAVVTLLKTLASLREQMLITGLVPDRIEIVTGWGRHSRVSGFSKIKNVVDNILEALHAPFYVDSSNVGCFVGSGQPLMDWLHEPDIGLKLAL